MTQTATGAVPVRPPVNRRSEFERFVAARISMIQGAYLNAATRSWGGAQLAALRHAAAQPAGQSPDTWMIEFDGFPTTMAGRSDQPSPAEWAAHLAFTLYAIHQQSNTTQPMHQPGVDHSLGLAVRQLARSQQVAQSDYIDEVPARFAALGTATEPNEIAHYARMLVHQLASANPPIPLDYARLAGQLFDLRGKASADRVRLQWGREFAGQRPNETTTPDTTTSNQEGN
jgi:CRISPR system Cascade subunit CasB